LVRLKQFDVFPNRSARTRDTHPFFIILQSDMLERLNTRIVAPLFPASASREAERFTPVVVVDGDRYMIDMSNIGLIPLKAAAAPVANLESERYRLVAAIDLVFTGI
jgi:toxin CcdB